MSMEEYCICIIPIYKPVMWVMKPKLYLHYSICKESYHENKNRLNAMFQKIPTQNFKRVKLYPNRPSSNGWRF